MGDPNPQPANPLQQFLTPESMLTPGVAGALIMMITNALGSNFHAPRAWTGLVLSFVFGLLVLVSSKQLIIKGTFYVLNSLVIFCVAAGASGLASGGQQAFNWLGINSAFAQSNNGNAAGAANSTISACANLSSRVAEAQKNGASGDQIVKLVQPCEDLSRDLKKSGTETDVTGADKQSNKFFAPWRF